MRIAIFMIIGASLAWTPLATPALTVNHEAPGGIAAISLRRVDTDMAQGESNVYYILTTSGEVWVQVWNDGDTSGEDWKTATIDWPVPFAEVVDWQPGIMYPAVDEPTLAAGVITTSSGECWRVVPEVGGSWDQSHGVIGSVWQRVTPGD